MARRHMVLPVCTYENCGYAGWIVAMEGRIFADGAQVLGFAPCDQCNPDGKRPLPTWHEKRPRS